MRFTGGIGITLLQFMLSIGVVWALYELVELYKNVTIYGEWG